MTYELTTENVIALMKATLHQRGEPIRSPIVFAVGLVNKYGFPPARVEAARASIADMINQLPTEFLSAARGGCGGWSFLQLGTRKDGTQWAEAHSFMDDFLCLALATGQAQICAPRELWDVLPGGLPYVVFDPEGRPQDTTGIRLKHG